jgi:hypothetical protein
MVTLNGHFDGKAIVPDDPASLALRPGTRLKVSIEAVDESAATPVANGTLRPLNIQIDPALSKAIALEHDEETVQ